MSVNRAIARITFGGYWELEGVEQISKPKSLSQSKLHHTFSVSGTQEPDSMSRSIMSI
jgi:hypothetical protein